MCCVGFRDALYAYITRLYDDRSFVDTRRRCRGDNTTRHVAARRRAPDCRSQSDQPSSIGQQAAGITLYAGRATDGDAPQGAGVRL